MCEHFLLALHVFGHESFDVALPRQTRKKRGQRAGWEFTSEPDDAPDQQATADPSVPAPELAELPVEDGAEPAPDGAEPVQPPPVLTAEFLEITERQIARSLQSFDFFEQQARRRQACRITRL